MRRALSWLVVLGVVELLVIVQVATWIGVVDTIGLLLLVSVLGGFVVRAQGLATLRRFLTDVEARRVPGLVLADAALIAAAGVFLVFPGFVTDVPGLLLLVPPVRRLVRGRLRQRWTERFIDVRSTERGRPEIEA